MLHACAAMAIFPLAASFRLCGVVTRAETGTPYRIIPVGVLRHRRGKSRNKVFAANCANYANGPHRI